MGNETESRDDATETDLQQEAAEPDKAEADSFAVRDRRFWVEDESGDGDDEPATTRKKPSYVARLEEKLAEKDAKLIEYIEAHKAAERRFEDARARLARQHEEELGRAKGRVVTPLFEVLDNLDRSLEAAAGAGSVEAFAKGVRIVRNQFLAALEALGLERFDPSGEPFDPTCHEAVSVVPAASAEEVQRVQHVLRSGYRQGEHVLRPAMVVVGRWDAPAD